MEEKIQNAKYALTYSKGISLPKNSNFISITIADDTIYKNINGEKKTEINSELTDKIWKLLNSRLETIIELSNKEKTLEHYKSSSKDQISIKIIDKHYLLTGKVADDDIKNFYNKIISEILNILGY